jgi:hypothetical protein
MPARIGRAGAESKTANAMNPRVSNFPQIDVSITAALKKQMEESSLNENRDVLDLKSTTKSSPLCSSRGLAARKNPLDSCKKKGLHSLQQSWTSEPSCTRSGTNAISQPSPLQPIRGIRTADMSKRMANAWRSSRRALPPSSLSSAASALGRSCTVVARSSSGAVQAARVGWTPADSTAQAGLTAPLAPAPSPASPRPAQGAKGEPGSAAVPAGADDHGTAADTAKGALDQDVPRPPEWALPAGLEALRVEEGTLAELGPAPRAGPASLPPARRARPARRRRVGQAPGQPPRAGGGRVRRRTPRRRDRAVDRRAARRAGAAGHRRPRRAQRRRALAAQTPRGAPPPWCPAPARANRRRRNNRRRRRRLRRPPPADGGRRCRWEPTRTAHGPRPALPSAPPLPPPGWAAGAARSGGCRRRPRPERQHHTAAAVAAPRRQSPHPARPRCPRSATPQLPSPPHRPGSVRRARPGPGRLGPDRPVRGLGRAWHARRPPCYTSPCYIQTSSHASGPSRRTAVTGRARGRDGPCARP